MTTKIKLSLWVLLMAFALFTGCNKEDQVLDPTITLDGSGSYHSGNKEVTPDTTLKVKVTALKGTDGKDLDEMTVKVSYNNAAAITDTTIKSISAASKTVEFLLQVSSNEGTERWTFEVKDKDGKTASASFTLTVKKKSTTTPTAPKEFTGLTFTSINRFGSTSEGSVYNAAAGQTNAGKVDICYFISDLAASGNNFVSPTAMNNDIFGANKITWGTMPTVFKSTTLSSSDFANLDDETKLKGFYDGGSVIPVPTGDTVNPPGSRVNQGNGAFAASKVIAFYNGSKYGLILIKTLGTAPTGGATIDVKVQN